MNGDEPPPEPAPVPYRGLIPGRGLDGLLALNFKAPPRAPPPSQAKNNDGNIAGLEAVLSKKSPVDDDGEEVEAPRRDKRARESDEMTFSSSSDSSGHKKKKKSKKEKKGKKSKNHKKHKKEKKRERRRRSSSVS